MKKSKIVLVTVLTFVLCCMCVTSTTFSWFTRPQTLRGDSLVWNSSNVVSDGSGLSMTTYASTDGLTYDETNPVTSFSGSVASGENNNRKYYRTDITNAGNSAQSVSLYLSNLKIDNNNNGFYLGVNGPLKTYKNYSLATSSFSESKTATSNLFKDVYIGFVHGNSYNYNEYKLWFWETGKDGLETSINYYHGTINISGTTYDVYHAQVPWNITNGKVFKYNNGTKDWLNVTNGDDTDGNNNNINTKNIFLINTSTRQVTYTNTNTAAGLNTFYSDAYVAKGNNTFDLSATGQGTLSYSSSNTEVATVNSSTGVVTAKKAGTTTITVTSSGTIATSGGNLDTQSAACNLTVFESEVADLSYVPIVTNLRISAAVDGEPTTESVYWYIKNEKKEILKYTIDDMYLTL